ncbi:MAG: A/G-specific adenine glycosylase [Planctomycetales bacterium 4572_13]|nr:MAG: A/G-specific adenine glycosylase [Planctomycetales bacterium 4572_13]
MIKSQATKIQQPLLRWFHTNARDLPWRRNRTPYAVWVSEIMLQQTQVTTVIDYYNRFMKRFPTVEKLARARQDTVLKLWEGLGYYSRGRNLHKAAKTIVRDYGGQLPDTVDELQKIPGIGRYTAGAIASIAFNRPAPILDGNVIRVLCRVFRIKGNPKDAATKNQLWELAERLVHTKRPGDFNEAMMELGATVCTPSAPACVDCPLRKSCAAFEHNEQQSLPLKQKKASLPHYTIAVGVVFKSDKILIDKRKQNALLGGLWEFPGGKKKKDESFKEATAREVKEETDIEVEVGKRLCIIKHTYSHFKVTLHAFQCGYLSGKAKTLACDAVKWVSLNQLSRYAFPTSNKRIIEVLKIQ